MSVHLRGGGGALAGRLAVVVVGALLAGCGPSAPPAPRATGAGEPAPHPDAWMAVRFSKLPRWISDRPVRPTTTKIAWEPDLASAMRKARARPRPILFCTEVREWGGVGNTRC